ncbi:hypothetical protein Z517_07167 [Fonsecaea pedrosoi CBS 271.37]|uniref:Protein kinase domain-containing protein n=1 Tax=Fonsecaea pedrosoi CBS 271.37 TaxID=1442368 RepID=A0A0D2DRN8_9EURO|nr:uncharacterized protein Z517_07167 [Fonsecaea pedrosoi CBS 271.37]KIW80551.1 hypothetical protein Z517_07167 [Fonsecaea pedrosoi CBS 271.37]
MSAAEDLPDDADVEAAEYSFPSVASNFSGVPILPSLSSSACISLPTADKEQADEKQTGHRTWLDFFLNIEDCGVIFVPYDRLQRGQAIGKGHTGAVFKGSFNGKPVALKYTNIDSTRPPSIAKERQNDALLKETGMELRVMTHPDLRRHANIIDIHAISLKPELLTEESEGDLEDGQPQDELGLPLLQPVIVMELAVTDLRTFMLSNALTAPETRARLASEVTHGISGLHKADVTVGDIKPDNILLFRTSDGSLTAKIADFGFARGAANLVSSPDVEREVRGSTLPWRGPEHWDLDDKACPPTMMDWLFRCQDSYSLGLVLAFILFDFDPENEPRLEAKAPGGTPSLRDIAPSRNFNDLVPALGRYASHRLLNTLWAEFRAAAYALDDCVKYRADFDKDGESSFQAIIVQELIDRTISQTPPAPDSEQSLPKTYLLPYLLTADPLRRMPVIIFQRFLFPDPLHDQTPYSTDRHQSSRRTRNNMVSFYTKASAVGEQERAHPTRDMPPAVRRVLFQRMRAEAAHANPWSEHRKIMSICYGQGFGCKKNAVLAKRWNDSLAMAQVNPDCTGDDFTRVLSARHQALWASTVQSFSLPDGLGEPDLYRWYISDILLDATHMMYPMHPRLLARFVNMYCSSDGVRDLEYAKLFWQKQEITWSNFVGRNVNAAIYPEMAPKNVDLANETTKMWDLLAPRRHVVLADDAETLLRELPPESLQGDSDEAERSRTEARILFELSIRIKRPKCFELLFRQYGQRLKAETEMAPSDLQTTVRAGDTDALDFVLNYTQNFTELTSVNLWIDLAEYSQGYIIRHVLYRLAYATGKTDFLPSYDPRAPLPRHEHAGNFRAQSPLVCKAIEQENWSSFLALLDAGIDVNILRVKDGLLPIHLAAGWRLPMFVAALRSAGSTINVHDVRRNTALHYVLQDSPIPRPPVREDWDMTQFLESSGIARRFRERPDWTQQLTLKLLVSMPGIDLDVRNQAGFTPLNLAASIGNTFAAQLLMERGADSNILTFGWQSVLQSAVASKSLEMVKLVYPRTTHQLNESSLSGLTPLLMSACVGQVDICQFLLEEGADFNSRDQGNRNIIHACCEGASVDTLELVMAWMTSLQDSETEAGTPLESASGSMSRLINEYNLAGCLPLHEIFKSHEYEICDHVMPFMELLLPYVDDINAREGPVSAGATALHHAAGKGLPDVVRLLLENGADPNLPFGQGWTPLHMAHAANSDKVIELLMTFGAEAERDNSGRFPGEITHKARDWYEKSARARILMDRARVEAQENENMMFMVRQASQAFPELDSDLMYGAHSAMVMAQIQNLRISSEIDHELKTMEESGSGPLNESVFDLLVQLSKGDSGASASAIAKDADALYELVRLHSSSPWPQH